MISGEKELDQMLVDHDSFHSIFRRKWRRYSFSPFRNVAVSRVGVLSFILVRLIWEGRCIQGG